MVAGVIGLLTHLALLRVVAANRPDDGSVIVPHPQMVARTVLEVLPVNAPVATMPVRPVPLRQQPHPAVVPPAQLHLPVSIIPELNHIKGL